MSEAGQITSLAKEVMFSLVWFVCLSVCEQYYFKSYGWILMDFMKNKIILNFGGDLDPLR